MHDPALSQNILVCFMTKIGLISDTHGYLDQKVFAHFKNCDEIWHAGDFGTLEVIEQLKTAGIPLRGVYGNVDGYDIRVAYPEQLVWTCEQVKVLMTHIGGYPPKYNAKVKSQLKIHQPLIMISGHSHILKIMYDENLKCLHMNPGAAGRQGWHLTRTIILFTIDGAEMKDCNVIELGKR